VYHLLKTIKKAITALARAGQSLRLIWQDGWTVVLWQPLRLWII